MAKNKELNQQALYSEDYSFNFESFYVNPDGHMFTPDDIAYLNARELEAYEQNVPMTPYEKSCYVNGSRLGTARVNILALSISV